MKTTCKDCGVFAIYCKEFLGFSGEEMPCDWIPSRFVMRDLSADLAKAQAEIAKLKEIPIVRKQKVKNLRRKVRTLRRRIRHLDGNSTKVLEQIMLALYREPAPEIKECLQATLEFLPKGNQ